jgi:hypothetical protein
MAAPKANQPHQHQIPVQVAMAMAIGSRPTFMGFPAEFVATLIGLPALLLAARIGVTVFPASLAT